MTVNYQTTTEDTTMSSEINLIALALCKAQQEMESAEEDKKNPYYSSFYPSLKSVWKACRDCLTKNEISIAQTTITKGNQVYLCTIMMHSSGQWIRGFLPLVDFIEAGKDIVRDNKVKKSNASQAIASALTLMRRIALSAMVGVSPGRDDDGNASGMQQYQQTPQNDQQKKDNHSNAKAIDIPSGYDEFVKKHRLNDEEKHEYICVLAKSLACTSVKIICSAMKRPESFMEAFEKWKSERNREASVVPITT